MLAWVVLARPFAIIASLKGRSAFNAAYFFGFFFNLFSIYWVAMVSPPGMVAAVVILGFYYAAALYLFNRAWHYKRVVGLVLLPFIWTGLEYFRTLSEFGFPWSDLGYTQGYFLYILQIVSIISVHGLTFIILVVNILVWQLFRSDLKPERRLTSVLLPIGIVALLTAYGWAVMPVLPTNGTYPIALLQGSVPIEVKWAPNNEGHSLGLYDSLATATQSQAEDSVELFIWPETSAPCYLSHEVACRRRVAQIARRSDGYHLVGAMAAEGASDNYRYFNACYQFSPAGIMEERHDKVKLVPFAEHVPYQDYVPFLQKQFLRKYLTFIDQWGVQWWSDYYPGDTATVFEVPGAYYGVLICFETAFPEYVRGLVRNGANFIVGITNDTWFGRSVGIYMHSRMFVTRAVENRCWSARCANSGLTYIVDAYGRQRGELELYEVAALVGKLKLLDEYSVYTEYGDVAGRISFLVLTALAGTLLIRWVAARFTSR